MVLKCSMYERLRNIMLDRKLIDTIDIKLKSLCIKHTNILQRNIDPNGCCLFAAGLPTDTVGSQNFQTFSTRQSPHLGDWWGELATATTT